MWVCWSADGPGKGVVCIVKGSEEYIYVVDRGVCDCINHGGCSWHMVKRPKIPCLAWKPAVRVQCEDWQ
jgi:hypothetical protein